MPSAINDDVSRFAAVPSLALHLVDTNINSFTGLATDYLNHFNEAIMLLEMLPEMPDCLEDFLAWQPMSYREHFSASKFKDREMAIAAYDHADPARRERLDSLAKTMNEILLATREVMRQDLRAPAAARIADLAVRWLKPLIARTGGIINGTESAQLSGSAAAAPQAAVDALLAR
jgi:hypothetical protein